MRKRGKVEVGFLHWGCWLWRMHEMKAEFTN
jgi:hypothetical protein